MDINVYLHTCVCAVRMKAYRNEILRMLNKTIDDEPVCVCIISSNYEI